MSKINSLLIIFLWAILFTSCSKVFYLHNNDFPNDKSQITKLERLSEQRKGFLKTNNSTYRISHVKIDSNHASFFNLKIRESQTIPLNEIREFQFIDHSAGATDGFIYGGAVMFTVGFVLGIDAANSPEVDLGILAPIGFGIAAAAISSPLTGLIGYIQGRTNIYRPSQE